MAKNRDNGRMAGPENSDPINPGYTIHRIKAEHGWRYPEHKHTKYGELVCATHGEFKHCINGETTIQRAGEIVFIRETDSHSLSGEKFAYVNVMFNESWLLRLEQYIEYPGLAEKLTGAPESPRALVPLHEQSGIEQSLEQLLSHSSSAFGRRFFSRFLLTVVTLYLAPLQKHTFAEDVPEWLRESLVWLSDQRPRYPSLQDLIQHSCRCHEHFSREFSRHMGLTPSRYLANLKIEHAAEMLLTTNHKLLEICHASGFENESYFFRQFRTSKGLTPLAYRRTYGRNSIQR